MPRHWTAEVLPAGRPKAGVIGWPIEHTLSPAIHHYWLRRQALRGAYVALPVAPAALGDRLSELARAGFAGLNVTVPHKEAVMAHLDRIDPVAARLGSVNMVTFETDGRLVGRSTDGEGFIAALRAQDKSLRSLGGKVVVLGAGGAARAITGALLDRGAEAVYIVNRTRERAERLAGGFQAPALCVASWENRADVLAEASLLVNTTSLGMHGCPPLELDLHHLPPTAMVVDIVYRPLRTALLEVAARRGNDVVDGLGMLMHQARPCFETWFGAPAVVDEALRNHVVALL